MENLNIDSILAKVNKPVVQSKIYQGLKVVGLAADASACGFYRVINPFWYLNKYGAECKYVRTCTIEDLMWADVIVAQRQYEKNVMENIVMEAQKRGKLVIYEVDDNLHAVTHDSPVYKIYHGGTKETKMVSSFLSTAQGLTVSTPELAGDYSGSNPNVEVLPNGIDFEMRNWSDPVEDKDPNFVHLLWAGGSTHIADLRLLKDIVPRVLKKYDHVKFTMYTSEQLTRMMISEFDIDESRVLFIPPKSFQEYPQNLSYGDIGLAVTVNNRFNSCKSGLRCLEYGAWGIPTVASIVPPYVTTIQHKETGMIGLTYENISYLIENESERKRMGENAKRLVKEQYDTDKLCHLWPQAWKTISENAPFKKTLKPKYKNYWGNVGRNDKCPCGSQKKYKSCSNLCYPAWGF